jgi:hypothetical protein
MLLGQSVFQSVLTRLEEEQKDEDVDATLGDLRVPGLGASFVVPSADRSGNPSASAAAYLVDLPDEPAAPRHDPSSGSPPVEDAAPPHLQRITEAEVAEELALTAVETEASLNEKRRRFAKINHPDRVAPQWRDSATIRMTIANLLIDRAIENLS